MAAPLCLCVPHLLTRPIAFSWVEPEHAAAFFASRRKVGGVLGVVGAGALVSADPSVEAVPPNAPSYERVLAVASSNEVEVDIQSHTMKQFHEFLWTHFESDGPRTPVNIDDKYYAYIVAGIAHVSPASAGTEAALAADDSASVGSDASRKSGGSNETCFVLLFDPHAHGTMADVDWSLNKGGARWVEYVKRRLVWYALHFADIVLFAGLIVCSIVEGTGCSMPLMHVHLHEPLSHRVVLRWLKPFVVVACAFLLFSKL